VSWGDPERFDYGFLPPSLSRQIRDRFMACGGSAAAEGRAAG
jgi:hypothetical protein